MTVPVTYSIRIILWRLHAHLKSSSHSNAGHLNTNRAEDFGLQTFSPRCKSSRLQWVNGYYELRIYPFLFNNMWQLVEIENISQMYRYPIINLDNRPRKLYHEIQIITQKLVWLKISNDDEALSSVTYKYQDRVCCKKSGELNVQN